nr:capsule biosynthesis GfcC family protein [Sodalis-like endosymbiont of Proechinophthirus fluctus]
MSQVAIVAEYLQTYQQRLSSAEKSWPGSLRPTVKRRTCPWLTGIAGMWKWDPGSIIYVGFSSWSLSMAYRDVNEQIISLLTTLTGSQTNE